MLRRGARMVEEEDTMPSCTNRVDAFGLRPESFKVVKLALFIVEDVNHDIVKIKEHPETFGNPFGG